MKRTLICLILVLACLTTTCFVAAAEGSILCGGSEVTAVPGKTVLFPVYMESTEQIASCKIYVTCDTSVFSAEAQSVGYRVEKGEVTKSGNIFANTYGNAGWQINWVHTRNVTANGVFCYLPLQVAEDAEIGVYTVEVFYSVPNTCDQDGNDVAFTCKSGSIRVETTDPTIYTEDVNAVSGQMVDVPICIRNNPGVTSLLLKVTENGWGRLVTDADGQPILALAEPYSNGSLEYNERTPGQWEFLWYSTDPVAVDGPVFTMQVQTICPDGEAEFSLSYDEDNTLTTGDKKQSFSMKPGTIYTEEWPVRDASFSDGVLHVQMEEGFSGNDLVIYAAVRDQYGRQKAVYSIDPSKESSQIAVEKESTDTVTIYAMTAGDMVPVMKQIELR